MLSLRAALFMPYPSLLSQLLLIELVVTDVVLSVNCFIFFLIVSVYILEKMFTCIEIKKYIQTVLLFAYGICSILVSLSPVLVMIVF